MARLALTTPSAAFGRQHRAWATAKAGAHAARARPYAVAVSAVQRLASATRVFLDDLDDTQRQKALLPFDDTGRREWAYTPGERTGVPLWLLSRSQTKAAYRLLGAMVAPAAFARATAIIALEEVLDRLEGGHSGRRHSGDYWLGVFGRPDREPWGVRFEGHHISVNATVASGEVTLTPLFLGANPAVVWDGGQVVVAPLAAEERLGFELLHALSAEQRSSAVFSEQAPNDIITRNLPRVDGPLDPVGVPLSGLYGAAAITAAELVRIYVDRFPGGVRRSVTGGLRFGWAGALEPGTGHYYRLAGPRFLVELDNTQDSANHVHSVVRDPDADFGEDLLAAHYRRRHS